MSDQTPQGGSVRGIDPQRIDRAGRQLPAGLDDVAPLTRDKNGKRTLSLADGFYVNGRGEVDIRLGPNLTKLPGSPVRIDSPVSAADVKAAKKSAATAQQTAIAASNAAVVAQATANAALPGSVRGAALGVAPLNAAMQVPIANLPIQNGSATLVAGAVTVVASVNAQSSIIPILTHASGTTGSIYINNRVNGAPGSFDILSTSILDTSTAAWVVIG